MSSYLSIPINQISPSKHQARKAFDEESITGLAESMKLEGLLQPVTVRKVGEGYELISGERRVRAAKLLGWSAIEAKVIETATEGEAAAKGLVENLQREDLNPIEEAEGFQELNQIDPKYWTQARIGQITGRSESFVNRSLGILSLPDPILENLRARKFSRSHALELARLPTSKQQLEVANKIPGHLTWEETRALVDQMLGKKPTQPSAPSTPPLADPLASLWIDLQQNPGIPLSSWKAKYEGPFTWTFRASIPAVGLASGTPVLQAALGDWFRAMADAMGQTREAEARSQKVRGSMVPSSEAEFKQAEAEQANLRLPQTPADWAELETRAAKGPSAVYAWIYGETSLIATQAAHLTWQDLGQSDPIKGCHQLFVGIRQMQELMAEDKK